LYRPVAVFTALDRLSSQERLIVVLSVLQGYTTREISEALGLPHGTVSSKLYRALKRLKSLLETA
jgi:RNA polymerase sigma-70 factor (ECF subfamily)